ncbi:MAG: extracellular metalloprotease Mpr [Roseiflexaceae bacterium]
MKLTTNGRRLSARMIVLSLLALIAVSTLAVAPAHAQGPTFRKPQSPQSPHSPVSSDGVLPVAKAGGNGRMTQAFAGTGYTSGSGINKFALDFGVGRKVAGPVSPESVIGADGRYQITSTTAFPYRAIVHITSSIGGCSGWMISANTVATAGHCIYGNSGWATNVQVFPGRSGSSTPYGSCSATRLFAPSGWTSSRSRDYDYGAIKLNCSIGNTVGWFGMRVSSSSLTGQASYTAGYPGDKAYATMWRSDDSVRITQTRRLYYANDTFGGQSGSIVWNSVSGCSTCAIAIHAYGVDGTGYNGGTRIIQEVYNNLTTWANS